jgi:hypothetical protein
VYLVSECILVYDGFGYGGSGGGDAHVFLTRHGRAKIKVFEIEGGKAGARSGDYAVEE